MNYLSKENVHEVLSLTHLKNGLLAAEGSAESGGRLMTQVVYEVDGAVDAARFQQAWDWAVQAHPELRSVYRSMKNRLVQVVLKTRPVPVEVCEGELQVTVEEMLAAHRKPFVTGEGPLMRLGLVVDGGGRKAAFVWTYHQLILDERSSRLVLGDVLEAYGALGREESLPALQRPSFKEYQTWLAGQDWSEVKADLAEQFAGFEAPTALLNGPRVHVVAGMRERLAGRLSEQDSLALQELAEAQGVTGRDVVHAAWALLLQVYSGEDVVFFGATLPGRSGELEGVKELIGRFENTVPVRIQVDGEQTVAEVLQAAQAQRVLLENYAFLPLQELQEYGGLSAEAKVFESAIAVHEGDEQTPSAALKEKNRAVIVNVAFETASLQVTTDHSGTEGTLQLTPTRIGGDFAPLTVEVTLGDTWQVVFSATEGAWDAETLARMQGHLVTVLESLAGVEDAASAKVRELNVLPEWEREKVFVEFNQTFLPQPSLDRLAHQVIEEQVAKRPDAVACLFAGKKITYRELNERANRLAHWLRGQGFGRDDLAALFAERGDEMLVAIVAVLKAGGAYVPLDTAHPDSRLRTILENSKAKVILTQNELTERSLDLAKGLYPMPLVFCLERSNLVESVPHVGELQAYSSENPEFVNEPGDLANVFFTSGSTGLPKGAMIEHIGMLNHLYAKIHLLGLNENSVVVQNASHCFDISVWQFLAPLMVGGTVAIYGNETAGDPQALLESVRHDQATVLEMVPAMIEMFLFAAAEMGNEARELPHLQYMISTGEGLPVALMHKWLQAYPSAKLVNTYGATECSDDTSHEVVDGEQGEGQNFVTLGKPIPNFKTYLLDRWNRPVPIGCVGEICLTGIGVGRGYLNDPERTAKAFVPNPFADGMGERMYRTGDLGRYTPSGELLFVSRIDHQVKVRGHRIELGEIEAVLREEPAVQLCVAVVKPDSQGQNRILAYVVGEGVSVDALREKLEARLPEYMIPEHFVLLDEMPLNRNGKIDRKALPDPQDVGTRAQEIVLPRNEIEAELVQIWQEVLGTEAIGIEDNFFHLGGHSLRTVQVRSRVKNRFGVDVPLKMLFDLQTVAELGEWISQATGQGTDANGEQIPRVPKAEYYPMSPAQRRIYLQQMRNVHNTAFNMPNAFRLRGPLVLKALRQAFQMMIDRHASLRTTFEVLDGQHIQRVAERVEFMYQAQDLSLLEDAVREVVVQEILQREMAVPYDLQKGPLFRVRVLRVANEEHVIYMDMHHIISDLTSWRVLLAEFVTLYQAILAGEEQPLRLLRNLPVSYVDVSAWQNERVASGELAVHEQYWLNKLSGELPVLQLPTDFPRPAIQEYHGEDAMIPVPAALVDGIKEIGLRTESTLFMVLLAATGVLLHRVTGQEDFIIGSSEAGRDRTELEGMIGFFINRLPLRVAVEPELSFLGLLEQARQTAVEAYEANEYPFDRLVSQLVKEPDHSRFPLLSVMFQVVRHEAGQALPGIDLTPVQLAIKTAKLDLYVGFVERADGLDMVFDYASHLFKRETVERWMADFLALLAAIVNAPERTVGELVASVEVAVPEV